MIYELQKRVLHYFTYLQILTTSFALVEKPFFGLLFFNISSFAESNPTPIALFRVFTVFTLALNNNVMSAAIPDRGTLPSDALNHCRHRHVICVSSSLRDVFWFATWNSLVLHKLCGFNLLCTSQDSIFILCLSIEYVLLANIKDWAI